ncbi:Coenzyme F420 hydrogenase/dehydrogenase, beta subunit C-terminal domain [Sphingobacterium rhinopitheci]|uniref:Coenzyme F420 hydrogenase/dehydrogenase, beta subunit C-terminal domain n=1 Tax=Sphingobacterium rhinopitheci TaxID=2781960 RepID=UPI001F517968|nr:Coenzyme F420 hydrogenase/dehydrogenase, beta subunit C-terminal domain [Sphingobacterium rhinopitheci]MCI0922715.1 Coenzyme F420 hydrogenase/dehydrogenase, beta subunit C-terminal domain [Sphingobacterium rhinopitheci]
MKKVEDILKAGLCLGCGLCEAVVGKEKCNMTISKEGFYRPQFKTALTESENNTILQVCPGISVMGNNLPSVSSNSDTKVWGGVLDVTESWSLDDKLRKKSATGGVISALAIHLLDSKKVDAILQVGVVEESWLYNGLLISRTKEEVFKNAQSRYAPALVFDRIIEILESSNDIFGFIGKPCDIAGIKNFVKIYPKYENRIKYTLAIFCAGIPSYEATKQLVNSKNKIEDPNFLKYRGDGWPGDFEAKWADGDSIKASYNDSWGKVLGKTLGLRCKICPDGIGLLADISTGDSWNTKDGYPDFTEADGRNFCFIRTENGKELYQDAVAAGAISNEKIDVSTLKNIHTYQYNRRILSAWRISAMYLITGGLIKFNNLGLLNIMFKKSLKSGVKEFLGTLKRIELK